MKKFFHIVGTRPNFVKAAPVIKALSNYNIDQKILHTGQHYSKFLSSDFFKDLELPDPDFHLSIGSGTHGKQTGEALIKIEPVLVENNPDCVIVYGDVNSTLAGAIAASKLGFPIAHIESGLRSFDNSMPEEINRKLVDHISDIHFVTEDSGVQNLLFEGIHHTSVYFVGNTMIDSLSSMDLSEKYTDIDDYILVTCHRPSNVDTKEGIENLIDMFEKIQRKLIFPVHPRTLNRIKTFGLSDRLAKIKNLNMMDPVGYRRFLSLMKNSALVITDSGGIQEETTFLGIPCLTIRKNTERPSTVLLGTNTIVGNIKEVPEYIDKIFSGIYKGGSGEIPPLWDGKASQRIAEILVKNYG